MICLLKFVKYSLRDIWLYDLKKILDFIYIPYYGTLKQWNEFLRQENCLYGDFLETNLDFKPDGYFHLVASDVRIDLDAPPLEISEKSRLFLMHDFYHRGGKTIWGLRKVVFSEEKYDNYFAVYGHIQPDSELPDSYKKNWQAVVQKGHP